MFSNFIKFIQGDVEKPHNFIVNKGIVQIISSREDFWIRYPLADDDNVRCSIQGEKLHIDTNKDNVHIDVNVNLLEKYALSLESGVVDVKHICKKSKVKLLNGTMQIHAYKNNAGILTAQVHMGVLNNHSDIPQKETSGGMFGGYYVGTNNSVSLVGDLEGYVANFEVDSGTVDIG